MTVGFACRFSAQESSVPPAVPPLADTLKELFAELHQAVMDDDPDRFLAMIDSEKAAELESLTRRNGFRSLEVYLRTQFANWPDLDTLQFQGLRNGGLYARLALAGSGAWSSHGEETIRYTFLLFRRSESGWKVAAIASIEKRRRDRYGHVVTYHEMDLPPKLRFPRLF